MTPAVVRAGGIGAVPAAAAPTAVTPPARSQRRRKGRGAVGALGVTARRRQGWSVGEGGACARSVGASVARAETSTTAAVEGLRWASVAYECGLCAGGVSKQQVCKNLFLVHDLLGRVGLVAPLGADGLIGQP